MSRRSHTRLAPLLLLLALPALGSVYLPPEEQQQWAEKLEEAQTRVEEAEERLERAEAAYTEARHDDYPAGEALAGIEREFTAAKRELEDARKAMKRLLEEARRAGVLPGVMRPYE